MHLCSCACGYTPYLPSFDGDLLLVQKMCAYSQATLTHAVAMNHFADEPEMHLFGNGIRAAGATQLANALRTNTTLKHLGLNNNKIGDAGATQLADALRTNTTLEHLYLCDNAVTDIGLMMLHDAIATDNCTLETLMPTRGLSWERSFKRLLAPAPRSQRRRRMAWARRRELLLCLHAAGLLLRATPQPQKKTVLAGRGAFGAFGAFGTFLADVPNALWPVLFKFL